MLTSQEVKEFLRKECGAEVVGIAPGTPFSEEDKKRIGAALDTLGRANPAMASGGVFDPEDFVEGAKAVIVFGSNSYFGADPYSRSGRMAVPRGAIGNFYLNQNMLNRATHRASQVQEFLQSHGFKGESPFVGFPQKIKALEAGIGIRGKNTLVIHEKLGTWFSVSTVITDAPLEPDEPRSGDCGTCNLCVEACPTQALSNPYEIRINRCLIYHLCHLKGDIPLDMREKMGVRIGNCTICSDVCPRNGKLRMNEEDRLPDEVIYPELIPLMNMGEDEYEAKYGSKMFGFIMAGRRYFRRNVAVALGNSLCEEAVPHLKVAAKDEDPLVRSHAEWAIEKVACGRTGDSRGVQAADQSVA